MYLQSGGSGETVKDKPPTPKHILCDKIITMQWDSLPG